MLAFLFRSLLIASVEKREIHGQKSSILSYKTGELNFPPSKGLYPFETSSSDFHEGPYYYGQMIKS